MMLDISDLRTDFGAKIRELEVLAIKEGIHPAKTSGARGLAHQARLYVAWRGWTKAGRIGNAPMGMVAEPSPAGVSRHHPFYEGKAAAVDLDAGPGAAGTDPKQARLTELARSIGLKCGLDWGDPVHYEMPDVDPFKEYVALMGRLDRQLGFNGG